MSRRSSTTSRRSSTTSVTDTGLGRRPSTADITPIALPELRPEQIQTFTEIGQGRFKTVFSGCYFQKGSAAILRYKHNNDANEVHMLALLSKHDDGKHHVVEPYGYLLDLGTILLVQELATFGSVLSVLQDPQLSLIVTPKHTWHIAAQFARIVTFLGSAHIIHTDIACRNFLVFTLDDQPERTLVKVTDFMSSLILSPQADRRRKKLPQASRWCAPETVAYNTWSYKSEVWSLGITLWELFSGGSLPWTKYDKRSDVVQRLRELAWSVNEGITFLDSVMANDFPDPGFGLISSSAHATLLSCIRPDAGDRPTSKQIAAFFEHSSKPLVLQQEKQAEHRQDAKVHASAEKDRAVSTVSALMPSDAPTKANVVVQPMVWYSKVAHEVDSSASDVRTQTPSTSSPTKANVVVQPMVWYSNVAHDVDSGASDVRTQTPSTSSSTAFSTPRRVTVSRSNCSTATAFSTPRRVAVARSSCSSGATGAGYSSASPALSYERYATPDAVSRLRRSSSLQSVPTPNIEKAVWHSQHWSGKMESLSNVRTFLSSPEAVCGLGMEAQVQLRRQLATAEAARDQSAARNLQP